MMIIFGTLIFVLVIFEVTSIPQSDTVEDGRRDYKHKLATAEKHSLANMGAVQPR